MESVLTYSLSSLAHLCRVRSLTQREYGPSAAPVLARILPKTTAAGPSMIRPGETRTRQDREPSPLSRVEPTVHTLTGLEGRDPLLGHGHPFPIARVAPGA